MECCPLNTEFDACVGWFDNVAGTGGAFDDNAVKDVDEASVDGGGRKDRGEPCIGA